MTKTIKIDVVRPVNPTGLSFIRYCWGAMGARDQKVITEYKREFAKLLRILGAEIAKRVGEGVLVTGSLEFELSDESKPLAARALSLDVWEKKSTVEEVIEVRIAEEQA